MGRRTHGAAYEERVGAVRGDGLFGGLVIIVVGDGKLGTVRMALDKTGQYCFPTAIAGLLIEGPNLMVSGFEPVDPDVATPGLDLGATIKGANNPCASPSTPRDCQASTHTPKSETSSRTDQVKIGGG